MGKVPRVFKSCSSACRKFISGSCLACGEPFSKGMKRGAVPRSSSRNSSRWHWIFCSSPSLEVVPLISLSMSFWNSLSMNKSSLTGSSEGSGGRLESCSRVSSSRDSICSWILGRLEIKKIKLRYSIFNVSWVKAEKKRETYVSARVSERTSLRRCIKLSTDNRDCTSCIDIQGSFSKKILSNRRASGLPIRCRSWSGSGNLTQNQPCSSDSVWFWSRLCHFSWFPDSIRSGFVKTPATEEIEYEELRNWNYGLKSQTYCSLALWVVGPRNFPGTLILKVGW